MPDFYPIREAIKVTGVSVTTLRRLVRAIAADGKHPDRGELLPSVEDVRRMKATGEQFTWQISGGLLKRAFGDKMPRSKGDEMADVGAFEEVITLLRDQLQSAGEQLRVKDAQIASHVEIIHSLNERIHETNVLMATVQKQLALPEAQPPKPTPVKSTNPGKQSTPKRASRKGIFARLFR